MKKRRERRQGIDWPSAKPQDLIRARERLGYRPHRVVGSHYYMLYPGTPVEKAIQIAHHSGSELSPHIVKLTWKCVHEQLGTSAEEYLNALR